MDRFIQYVNSPDGSVDIVIPTSMVIEFKEMVKRASNTWQDMSPDMRHFADRVFSRESFVGENMKLGAQVCLPVKNNMLANRRRDCCNTMLKEPHHNQCAEKNKVSSYVKPKCNGHPETCNCEFHCR